MLASLRRTLGLTLARIQFRRSRDTVISFTRSVTSARQALVILPFGERAPVPDSAVFAALGRTFAEDHITLVGTDRVAGLAAHLPRSRFISVAPSDVSALFLPGKTLLQRIGEHSYDLAIDLNLDLVLPSAYICRKSGARVRVGLERRAADRFYNLVIHPDPSLGTQRLYERVLTCLEMF